MARIELSAEVRAIESLIDAGEHTAASTRLHAAHNYMGRRPEYRYLVCLYDSTFRVRSDRDLLAEMIELVGEQPDLLEAAALLAQLFTRLGDTSRADLFAHLALESTNPSTRARADEVLHALAGGADPPSSRVQQVDRLPDPVEPIPPSSRQSSAPPSSNSRPSSAPPSSRPSSAPSSSSRPSSAPAWQTDATPASGSPVPGGGAPPPARPSVRFPSAPPPSELPSRDASDPNSLTGWFERVRRDLVHRRSPTYGVRTGPSVAETLLDWGKTVAEGRTFVSSETLPLTRDGLAAVDDAILALRRQPGPRSASRSDTSRAMAAGGFFLAVVVHELDATVLEIAPADGGCKVLLPSGAGVRPLLVAAAFAEGTGPSLLQTFDRLAAARDLASSTSEAPYRRTSLQVSLTPASSPAVTRDELALTRPEVEAMPLRLLTRPTEPGEPPPLDLASVAAALSRSALSQDIASRSGAPLSPGVASIEALDSFCLATRGEGGTAPERATWQPSDDDEDMILTWGALLGETLIASYGGIWECDPNAPSDPRLFRVICEDRVAAWPITQVYLRLKNGSRAGLVDYLAAVGRLLA